MLTILFCAYARWFTLTLTRMRVCQVFRRVQEPSNKAQYEKSYFNLLIEYDSDLARRDLPGTFEYLQVRTSTVPPGQYLLCTSRSVPPLYLQVRTSTVPPGAYLH